MSQIVKGHIIFDHDGTLVRVDRSGFQLFPGMKDFIVELKQNNFEIYIWTARNRSSTITSIKQNELSEFLTDIYCADDGMMKPHPMGLTKLLGGVPKNQIIHIGDSETDLQGAINFGIDFIYAAWNDLSLGELYKSRTPFVANTILDCKKIIDYKFN